MSGKALISDLYVKVYGSLDMKQGDHVFNYGIDAVKGRALTSQSSLQHFSFLMCQSIGMKYERPLRSESMRLKLVLGALLISGCASVSNGLATVDKSLPVTSILYADRDVAVGSEITLSDLRIHWIPSDKKPVESLETFTQAVALKAKNRLVKGQIISDFDVVNFTKAQKNTTIVVLRLDNSVVQKLQRASRKKKISQSQICEGALTQYLSKKKKLQSK